MRPLTPASEPPGRQLPLRVRLTAWMVVIFLIVQLSIAVVVQLYLSRMIDNFFGERLRTRVSAMAESLGSQLPVLSSDQLAQSVIAEQKVRLSREFTVDVFDRFGRSVATSRQPPLRLEPDLLRRGFETDDVIAASLPSDALRSASTEVWPVRAALRKTIGTDGREYLVVLAANDAYATDMHRITNRVILASVVMGIIPIALSSYLIAGLAVRPLADIRVLAQRLSPESIDQYIDSASAAQEVAAVRAELELARQRIEAGFATQERFMSNVSHELKTPIAVVLTEIQTLKAEESPRRVRDFLRSATEELEKLGRTVDNFLLLTRIRQGKGQIPALEACLVRDVLLESYAGCTPMATLHRVRLSLHIPEGDQMDATVMGNCDLLRIIFDNIIRNAIRFSPESGVVEIRAEVRVGHVDISVRDNGPGIPADLLPRVFDRFSQAKDEERRGRGHGLGLEIALGIAELHSGTIVVRNRPEGGCEFVVSLPRGDGGAACLGGPFPNGS
ncbi:MAG TPA: HAMP domain-containing sensor histidine kinase [Phycisphaerales bacterium]